MTRFDPKAVVANSTTPKKKASWASAFMQMLTKAPMERALAAALKIKAGVSFTADERKNYAVQFRMRAVYGRDWWRSCTHEALPHQGAREVARRHRQIQHGLLSPVFKC